ncbi:DUF397 domain-containing protein [Streptomyces sp. NPDC093085]|uniref:DUF397 domain-containing protein n=1 Tax=Streptomyces sp. NPDC093085 TaxID=3155068 RepID=UPI00343C85E9
MSTTPTPGLAHAQWTKSSYSEGNGGQCLEWAPAHTASGAVPIRDSKNPHGPALTLAPDAWAVFVAGVQREGFPTV